MSLILGIDTSNYTTSAALYDTAAESITQAKQILPVKQGERGVRQSEALFHHTRQLPELLQALFKTVSTARIEAVGVSVKPRREEGSYMPCFLAGVSAAKAIASAMHIPLFELSHQEGHIAAALYSAKCLNLLEDRFIAFHISGGTTEALLVSPDKNYVFSTQIAAKSLDLKAGQAIDRIGVMLGLQFPAGAELEQLAEKSSAKYKPHASMKAQNCSLSGIENKCKAMLEQGVLPADIALFCMDSVIAAVEGMLIAMLKEFGPLPVVFSGGVTSNKRMRTYFSQNYTAVFAEPAYSADNAAGVSVLTAIKAGVMK